MKKYLPAMMATAALFAAGCGGGDKNSAGVPTSSTVTTTAMLTAEIEFRQYLSRTAAALKPYRAAQAIEDAADALVTNPNKVPTPAERKRAADQLVLAAKRFEFSAVKQLQAKPPAQLRAINRRFSALSTRIGASDRRRAIAARNADWNTWNRLIAQDFSDSEARSEWRDAVIAYAAEAGVTPPGWIRVIGTPHVPRG